MGMGIGVLLRKAVVRRGVDSQRSPYLKTLQQAWAITATAEILIRKRGQSRGVIIQLVTCSIATLTSALLVLPNCYFKVCDASFWFALQMFPL